MQWPRSITFAALLTIACMAFALFGVAGCGGPSVPPSFLLISLDTTRADHLGVYGYERDTTPFLDELAQRAVVFEDAIAPSQNTLISHASLLTGLSSSTHGATPHGEARPIEPAFTTLAEDLVAHGYRTAAFLAHADWLSAAFGFDQGFEAFTSKYRSANLVLEQAQTWLATRAPESPYFLFLHLYDVHSDWEDTPYDAPVPFRGKFATGKLDVQGMKASDFLGEVNQGNVAITTDETNVLRDQYDEGLAYVDHRLKLFFDSLTEETLQNLWVIILADHGEGFLEHGKLLHATFHDEIVRVPLMIVPPSEGRGLPQTPFRVAEQVRLVDLRPTVLSLAGLADATDVEGVDLSPCWRRDGECPSLPATLHASGLRFEGFKLLQGDERWHLYDLERDPGEKVDLGGHPEMQERALELQTTLDDLVARQVAMRERILRGAESPPVEMDPEAEERLKALGYVQ